MRKLIAVSRPPSGLYVVLCEEAADILGGIGSRFRVSSIKPVQDGIHVVIVRDAAGSSTLKTGGRIAVTNNRLVLLGTDVWEFGTTDLKWEPTGNGIEFTIPPVEELTPPNPHSHTKGRRLHNISDPTTPHARLGAALRTLNELTSHPELLNVRYYLHFRDDEGGQALTPGFKITGKRVIEEELG